MESFSGQDRRTAPRVPISTACKASFARHGVAYTSVMLDLSELGARFRLDDRDRCELPVGTSLSIEINTPYGTAICAGTVAWADVTDEYFEWGLQFTRLSPDPHDPLRSFMDSVF